MRISDWSSDVCSSDLADADQRGAPHLGMDVEHRFDLFGAQGAGGGDHALGLAAAEPEAAVGVEVAEVAHAVDDAGTSARCARALTQPSPAGGRGLLLPLPFTGEGWGEGALLTDLCQPRLRITVEVRVGGGGAGAGDLAHLAGLCKTPFRPPPNGVHPAP